jgi:hypothetical protein
MSGWNWLRLATAVAGGAAIVVGCFVPAAAAVLVPLGTGLVGVAVKTPGFEPKEKTT